MPTSQGFTLDRYLSEKGPLEPAQAARIAIQVAQQMGPAAGSLLIYPGRILATKEGITRLLPPPAEDLSLPTVVEFPAYASPEEIRGSPPDIRSSLYSLGCTLFELLTGRPPYSARDPKEVLRAHLEDPIPDVRRFAPKVSESIAETLQELLEKDPELRIQTAEEIIRRLKQGLSGGAGAPRPSRPAPAPAPPQPQRIPKSRTGAPSSDTDVHGLEAKMGAFSHKPPLGRKPGLTKKEPRFQPARGSPHLKHSKLRPGLSHATSRGGRSRRPIEEDLLDEEVQGPTVLKKKFYPFSIGGAILGLLIGIVIVVSKLRAAKELPAMEEQQTRELLAQALKDRKAQFLQEEVAKPKAAVDSRIAGLKRIPPENQRDYLTMALDRDCDGPGAYRLAELFLQLGPMTRDTSSSSPEDPGLADSYQKRKAEAEKLHAEGKLGAAIDAIMERYLEDKAHHEKEIDDLVTKWSDELTAKWDSDSAEIDRLAREGEVDKALDLCRKAMEYGDNQCKRQAEAKLQSIQAQVAISNSSEDSKTEEKETDLDKDYENSREKTDSGEEKDSSEEGKKGADKEGAGGSDGTETGGEL